MFNKNTITQLADSAMLSITDTEAELICSYMSDVTEMLDSIDSFPYELDCCTRTPKPYSVLRPDEACKTEVQITKNADNIKDNFFTVPKIV